MGNWLEDFLKGEDGADGEDGVSFGGPTITNSGTGTLSNISSDESGTPAGGIIFTGSGDKTLTGIADGTESRLLVVRAKGTGTLTIAHNTTSTVGNRIETATGEDVVVPNGAAALFFYDSVNSRWSLVGTLTTPGGDEGDLQIHGVGGTFEGLAGATDGDIPRFDGDEWTVEQGAEVPDGDEDDVIGLDGDGGLKNLGPMSAGGPTVPAGSDDDVVGLDGVGGLKNLGPMPTGAGSDGAATVIQTSDGAAGFDGAANVKAGSGYISVGATVPGAGGVRLANNTYLSSINGATSYGLIALDGSGIIRVGYNDGGTFGGTPSAIVEHASSSWGVFLGSYYLLVSTSAVNTAAPLAGYGSGSVPFRMKSATIAMTSAGTDVTASSSEYECPVLKLTGTYVSEQTLILPNTADAIFIINNQSSGDRTMKKSGGSGVTVASGKTQMIYHDGTNYVKVGASS